MRKLIVVATVLSLGFVLNSFAADQAKSGQAQVAAENQQKKTIKTIFSYKKELGLSDKQIEQMKAFIVGLQNYIKDKRNELVPLTKDLIKLSNDRADLKLIKEKLEKISKVNLGIAYTDIETSRNIEDVLTSAQLKKWKKVQQDVRDKAKSQAAKK